MKKIMLGIIILLGFIGGVILMLQSNEEQTRISKTVNPVYQSDNVLVLGDRIGDTIDTFDIVLDTEESKPFLYVDLKGTFEQEEIDGTMYFTKEDGQLILKSMYFSVEEYTYDEVKELFTQKYGEPSEEGVSPYVEVDGGVVVWANFEVENQVIRIQKGEKNTYTWIDFEYQAQA